MRRSAAWASLFARHLLLAQRTGSPILHLTAKVCHFFYFTLTLIVQNKLFSYSDDLLSSSPIAIQSRLDAIIACGITARRQLGRIVRNCPAVMFARDIDGMRRAAEALSGFFTRKEIVSIIVNCPQILLQNVEEVEKKYEYIYYRVRL
uniref:Required for respiratory growth protein 8, mitochondrial n=1 Tax=Heterorhabditis bacteriophora TaxID=37862 RepID=A0A1I7W8Y2_HETBA